LIILIILVPRVVAPVLEDEPAPAVVATISAFLMLALRDHLDEGTVVRVVSHAILSIKFRLLFINQSTKVNR
jgi:hypothetical protein